ncbi:MAG TPA: chorismate synthase, partial [Candidatus Omnitrophota bacterium]|nr:chorismate synthase [Candidatus Omnitrophota bacterium]
ESHGPAIGVVLDGVPPNIELSEADIQAELDRRKPGQSSVTTPRKEEDKAEILSGLFEGKTTGAPLAILIRNTNQESKDYNHLKDIFRPGHADFTYTEKYGIRDYRGGGRSSGRETACRVAAGAVAKKILHSLGIRTVAYTKAVGTVQAQTIDLNAIEKNPVRTCDPVAAEKMIKLIEEAKAAGDSVGGIVEAVVQGCPAGLGDPVFDKLNARLAQALFSIATIKALEFGEGFGVSQMRGSENNDAFLQKNGTITTATNHAGGILGGISNGNDIILRVAVKPPSSISKRQTTVTAEGKDRELEVKGRHDPCLCPRIVPVIEAMINVTLLDCWLIQKSIQ